MTTPAASWLLAIDLQHVFGAPDSPWAAPRYPDAVAGTLRLLPAFDGRTLLTRYVAPAEPAGAWVPYFRDWPFALVADSDPLYDLDPALTDLELPVETRATFGKWDAALAEAMPGVEELVVTGVSTDCCVLSTVLAAADAGIRVRVVTDACAGASDVDHDRALAAMALYAPLVELTTVDEVLAAH